MCNCLEKFFCGTAALGGSSAGSPFPRICVFSPTAGICYVVMNETSLPLKWTTCNT
jgi:hypothetical protein